MIDVSFLHRLRNYSDSDLFRVCIVSLCQGLKKNKCTGEIETGRERKRESERESEGGERERGSKICTERVNTRDIFFPPWENASVPFFFQNK